MYGDSPYGSTMGRRMFMDPQFMMMLQMRDQMKAQYAPQPTEMPQQLQMPQQQQTTEQTLEQLQANIQQMQQQQQRLSEHLGAGSGMLKQLEPQQGLGGLFQRLNSEPTRFIATRGPESIRRQNPVTQRNPFGG